jgi:hypothetical protein
VLYYCSYLATPLLCVSATWQSDVYGAG